MTKEDVIKRMTSFVLRVINLVQHLPNTVAADVIANQVLRSSTSMGANYRAACRSKSKKDFINKLKIVEEEADETLYWLTIIEECEYVKPEKLVSLKEEGNELISITVASLKTAKENLRTTIIHSTTKSSINRTS